MKTGEKGLLETTESDLYMSYRNVMAASLWLGLVRRSGCWRRVTRAVPTLKCSVLLKFW